MHKMIMIRHSVLRASSAHLTYPKLAYGIITRAPQGVRVIKCNRFPRQKGGSWSQAFHAWTAEPGDKTSLFVSTVFCGEFFGKNWALYFDVTYKDVDRFRMGSVHEL